MLLPGTLISPLPVQCRWHSHATRAELVVKNSSFADAGKGWLDLEKRMKNICQVIFSVRISSSVGIELRKPTALLARGCSPTWQPSQQWVTRRSWKQENWRGTGWALPTSLAGWKAAAHTYRQGPKGLYLCTYSGKLKTIHTKEVPGKPIGKENLGKTWKVLKLWMHSSTHTQIYRQRVEGLLAQSVWVKPLTNHWFTTKIFRHKGAP